MRFLPAVATTFLAVTIIAVVSCAGTPAPVGLSEGCSINSDCEGDLVCVFGRCHIACVTDKDCNGDAHCVLPGVCLLPQETTCSSTLPCVVGLTCVGTTCLASCSTDANVGGSSLCLAEQTCLEVDGKEVCEPNPVDAGVDSGNHKHDGAVVPDSGADSAHKHDATIPLTDAGADAHHEHDAAHDGTTATDAPADARKKDTGHETDSGGHDTGSNKDAGHDSAHDSGHDAGVDATNSCPIAQTQFGTPAMGASNSSFSSGVATRTANDLYIFSGYTGTNSNDSGTDNEVWVQAFDPQTSTAKGPPQPLFVMPDLLFPSITGSGTVNLYAAAVSPQGEIALVYDANFAGDGSTFALYVALLGPSADAGTDGGVAGLTLLGTPQILDTNTQFGPAHVYWSTASLAFVCSWFSNSDGPQVSLKKFRPNGDPAGSVSPVPTDNPGATVWTDGQNPVSGSAAESGNLLGVAWISPDDTFHSGFYPPKLTVLTDVGLEVGDSVQVTPDTESVIPYWVAVGGTAQGFVYFYEDTSTSPGVVEAFLPTSLADAGFGGTPDGGDASTLKSFTFTGDLPASYGVAASDGPGGAGGVGIGLVYQSEVEFAYVAADGSLAAPAGQVFSYAMGTEGTFYVSNFGGSFVVSLYDTSTHTTQAAVSGCSE